MTHTSFFSTPNAIYLDCYFIFFCVIWKMNFLMLNCCMHAWRWMYRCNKSWQHHTQYAYLIHSFSHRKSSRCWWKEKWIRKEVEKFVVWATSVWWCSCWLMPLLLVAFSSPSCLVIHLVYTFGMAVQRLQPGVSVIIKIYQMILCHKPQMVSLRRVFMVVTCKGWQFVKI